ncbi:dTMP kinase [Pararhodobacter oceanensis]|uniref:Thymidylate kinase n=1 Tax=Pararhodobacter oceanensis TaxID=2172121 RepID=A0A2T8HYB8_9RHOB|nr:dTMP kinase [Pararhodobacter oceanensis]PVH30433.1 dTMP kinase [Pararhodobacter oceanensis]
MSAGPRGTFISFEGIDGSGKSTQARLLAEALGAELTREPGGSTGAEEIRRLLVAGDAGRWSPETEILLFTAARRDHLEKTIRPALAAGQVIISDRFADSTRVYQGVARATLGQMVDMLHAEMIGIDPDLTFVIDMDPQTALTRGLARDSGEDRFESLGLEFQQKLRAGFRALSVDYPARVQVIDGDRPVEVIAAEVLDRAVAYIIEHETDSERDTEPNHD